MVVFFKKIKTILTKWFASLRPPRQCKSFKFYKSEFYFLNKIKNFLTKKIKLFFVFLFKKVFFPRPRTVVWTIFIFIVILTVLAGLVNYPTLPEKRQIKGFPLERLNLPRNKYLDYFRFIPFHLGLDLAGGAELIYQADLSQRKKSEQPDALSAVRDIIERRVNTFGVSEPRIRTQMTNQSARVVVELPGVADIKQAIKMIGETPILEFREPKEIKTTDLPDKLKKETQLEAGPKIQFIPTKLTGEHLKRAQVQFDQQTGQPVVSLKFDKQGKEIFAELTKKYVGQQIAIFLDGAPLSVPRVNEPILNGEAVITGNFTVQEARTLARRLNAGALPVPIKLVAQNQVEASLGRSSLNKSLKAGILGLLLVALFMIAVYRLPGFIAVLALSIYALIVLSIFKLWPVILTLAGIAGFILSIGMAVDANVLIFERMREEIKKGKLRKEAVEEGFRRAWPSIRDSNLSSLLTCWILAWFGSSIIRGFAITLAIGILISMFSAITVSRTFLRLVYGYFQK